MTVRVVVPQHQRANGGGIGRYVGGLTDALRAVPEEVEVVPVAVRAQRQGFAARFVLEQTTVPRAVGPGDVLHVTDLRAPFRAPRERTLVTVHDVVFLSTPEHHPLLPRRYKTALLDAMLRWGPAVVGCVSEHTRDELARHRPASAHRLRVLRPGVPRPPAGRPAAEGPRPHLLTVGSYDLRKNLGTLLEAFRIARARGLALDWVSVGATEAAPAGLVDALRAEPGVTVAGHVDDAELERLWSGAALLALPSVLEGFSFPAVEAMQRGVPVFAATGSALDETVGAHGLRADPLDVQAWADGLLRLAADAGLRGTLTASATAHVASLDWSARVGDFLDVYRELAAR